MARCVFIVQGEGRGHLSQAQALDEYLQEAGHEVHRVLVGTASGSAESLPAYFREQFGGRLETFYSPGFVKSHNRKGILVGRSFWLNLLRAPLYLTEVRRLRRLLKESPADHIFNFYELIGALALRRRPATPGRSGPVRIAIGHHFYHHLQGYPAAGSLPASSSSDLGRPEGRTAGGRGRRFPLAPLHTFLMKSHTRLVLGGSDRAWALSLVPLEGSGKIELVPPLIRRAFRELSHQPGERYLVYVLSEGYVYDLIRLAREIPDFRADVFASALPGNIRLPDGLKLHEPDAEKFRIFMTRCRALITTAGFETVAEALHAGVPLGVIPAQGHFEQYCNAADFEALGLGCWMKRLGPGELTGLGGNGKKEEGVTGPMTVSAIQEWVADGWKAKIASL